MITNCKELLDKRLQVRWDMQGDLVRITLTARLRDDQYMAFGLSGVEGRPQMIGADVTVAFYDASDASFHATDYYMSHTSQCDGQTGVCPDERIGGRNDVVLISGERKNNITTIVYTRPLQTNEPVKDRSIPSKGEVSVIAAFGPLNSRKEANAHSITDKSTDDVRIDFSSTNDASCENSLFEELEDDKIKPWPEQKIIGETTFRARIGPTGGKRGYTPITGHPSWGIAWWINDRLIPELYVERGQTYTFIVEGGLDSTNPAHYHPFYICDSSEGGYGQKSVQDQKKQKVYAGVEVDDMGFPFPSAAGRYCEWEHKTVDKSADIETFEAYVETLRLNCDDGEPGYMNWTVPLDAPELLYYQVSRRIFIIRLPNCATKF